MSSATLRFNVLGELEAVRDGAPLDLGPRKQRAVLAVLLLSANRVVPTERLIDDLWGDEPPETARAALQVHVAGLRKALGEDSVRLVTRSPGYVLEVEPGAVDLERFNELCARARAESDGALRSELLAEALELWRDVPLAGLHGEPFALAARPHLEELRLGALEQRIDADLDLGRHAVLVAELDTLVAEHPYRERFRGQQMLALYRSGRQADALAAYRAARQASIDDLGLEPGPELRALERAVLDQDPELAAPPSLPAEPPADRRATASRRPRRSLLALAALSAVVLTGVAMWLLRREPEAIVVPPNSVAVIDVESRRVEDVIPVGNRPGSLAARGPAVWVANLDDPTVMHVDGETRRIAKTIGVPATPNGVTVGAGAVWVVHGRLGQLSRIDPVFDRVTETIPIGSRAIQFPAGAVDVGLGSVWAAFGDATLARVDPRSVRESTSGFAGQGPVAVVVAGGAVWVANIADATVQRFSPLTFGEGPATTIGVGRNPSGLAAGAGSVWVALAGDDAVARIDPTVTSSSFVTIEVGDEPSAIAYGAEAIWVANRADGTVSRIDPETNDETHTIEVGGAPSGVAVWRDEVWVTVQ